MFCSKFLFSSSTLLSFTLVHHFLSSITLILPATCDPQFRASGLHVTPIIVDFNRALALQALDPARMCRAAPESSKDRHFVRVCPSSALHLPSQKGKCALGTFMVIQTSKAVIILDTYLTIKYLKSLNKKVN